MPIHNPKRHSCHFTSLSLLLTTALTILLSHHGNNDLAVSALIPTTRKSTLHTLPKPAQPQHPPSLPRSALFHRLPTASTSIIKPSKTTLLVSFLTRRRRRKKFQTPKNVMLKEEEDRPKIAIKPRKVIQYDATTTNEAFVRPSGLQLVEEEEEEEGYSKWSKFKNGFYDAMSSLSNISKRLKKRKVENKSVLNHPIQGYDDVVVVQKEKEKGTPGQRLLEQYEMIQREECERMEIVKKELRDQDEEEEDYFRSNNRKKFDNFKDGVYFALDKLSSSSSSSKQEKANKNVVVAPIYKLQGVVVKDEEEETKLINFKPVSKTASQTTQIEKEIQSYIPLLKSSNTIKRYRAKLAIQSLERKLLSLRRRSCENDNNNDGSSLKTKEAFYNLYDTTKNSLKSLSTLPSRFISTFQQTSDLTSDILTDVSDTIKSIPIQTSQTASTLINLPTTIQQSTIQTKQTLKQKAYNVTKITQDAIQDTQNFVQSVKNLPQTVQSNINQTKRSIQSTKQSVDDVIYDAKVVLNLEKPKPKPPPLPPPPPPTTTTTPPPMSDLAKTVAWDVTKLCGKITWNALCGMGNLASKGVQVSINAAAAVKNGKKSDGVKNMPQRKAAVVASASTSESRKEKMTQPVVVDTTSTPPLPSIAEIDVDLGKEVEDALNLVEATLLKQEEEEQQQQQKQKQEEKSSSSWSIFATSKTQDEETDFTTITNEINQALQRAKEAAKRATADAAQLEIIAANDAITRGNGDDDDDDEKKLVVKKSVATTTTSTVASSSKRDEKSNDLEYALQKAKEAADQATRDAESLESMLKEGH